MQNSTFVETYSNFYVDEKTRKLKKKFINNLFKSDDNLLLLSIHIMFP
jgi:hypothetical protein